MLITQQPKSIMLLCFSPLTCTNSRMNIGSYRRPIFRFKRFFDGQIRRMNGQRRRGMMIGPFQIIPPNTIIFLCGKIQASLIEIEMYLFVPGCSPSYSLKRFVLDLIQFDAFAFDCSHVIRLVSPISLFQLYVSPLVFHRALRKMLSTPQSDLESNHLSLQKNQRLKSFDLALQEQPQGILSRT